MTKVRKETFDLDTIRSLESLQYQDALMAAVTMVDGSNMKDLKKARLKLSLQKAKTPVKISEIMWHSYLAGEGLSSVTSKWNSR